MGWATEKWPELFGISVDEAMTYEDESSSENKEMVL